MPVRKFMIAVASVLTLAFGQSGLDAPRAGLALDPSGAIRNLRGVGGSFYWGGPLLEQVREIAWQAPRGVAIGGDHQVYLLGARGEVLRTETTPAPAAIASRIVTGFWDGVPIVSTGDPREIWILGDRQTNRVPFWLPGDGGGVELLAVSGHGTQILAAVYQDGHASVLRIHAATGEVEGVESLPDTKQVVFLAEERWVWSDGSRLCSRDKDRGQSKTLVEEIDLPAQIVLVRQLEWDSLHVTVADGRQFAVRVPAARESGQPRAYQIPEVAEK